MPRDGYREHLEQATLLGMEFLVAAKIICKGCVSGRYQPSTPAGSFTASSSVIPK